MTATTANRMSAEDETELARTIEAGVLAEQLLATGERPVPATDTELHLLVEAGQRASHRLLLSFARLVGKLAVAEAKRSGLGLEELYQEGFLAMSEALHRFDHRRARFSTYATVRVSQHLAEVGAGRLGALASPPSRALRLRRARGVAAALGQERQRTVDVAEVALAVGTSRREMARLLGYLAPVPVDAVAETLADPAPVDPDAGVYAEQFGRLVAQLESTRASIVRLRYGLGTGNPLDVSETAGRLGLSRSTVRRLEGLALAELRAMLTEPKPAARRYYREQPVGWPA